MADQQPALVELIRGGKVESTHAVDIVVADTNGVLVGSWGEKTSAIYPRSAIKALQALPLVESGAASAFGFEDRHLALACSSHNGENLHVDAAREMLEKAELGENFLECGAQMPRLQADMAGMVANGLKPRAIHNNCSGKHSGFLAFAAHSGINPSGYSGIAHPVQKEVANTLAEVIGTPHRPDNHGIDGCSIPTYTAPLNALAKAYARFGVGEDPDSARGKAMRKLKNACQRQPQMVAGKERACTEIMEALGERAFVKVGAEGVYCASLPGMGFGIALKVRDGAFRACETAIASLLLHYLDDLPQASHKAVDKWANPVIRNWNGIETGKMRLVLP